MTTMTSTAAAVIGGVDTHADVHLAAADMTISVTNQHP